MTDHALRLERISKSFGAIQANRDVTLSIASGTIHGVVGENGAGKTTLMRIAYGFYQPDAGRVLIDDVPVNLTSPRVALALGVGMVHQHSLLVDSMTVTENILLADPRPLLASGQAARRIRRLSEETGLILEPNDRVRDLSVANRQRLEILKALYYGARILILDEPTAVLTPQEARLLFDHLRTFAEQDRTIVIITHKLPEVLAVTTRVSVMRAGELVYEADTAQTDEATLARAMVGRSVDLRLKRPPARTAVGADAAVLSVTGLTVDDDRGVARVRGVDLDVYAGEIVAIAAVEGNGQRQLAEAITGLRGARVGRVTMFGEDITRLSPRQRRQRGMRHVVEDRLERGINPGATLTENVIAGRHHHPPFAGRWLMDLEASRRFAASLIDRFGIAAPGPTTRVGTLSGGNMQKVVIARELSDGAKLVIAAQPTQGVDVGATEFIRNQLVRLRADRAAILLISSELSEIVDLADRVYVMFGGEIVGEVVGDDIEEERLGRLMLGGARLPLPPQQPVAGQSQHV